MSRTHATRSIRLTIRWAGLPLLVAALVAGMVAAAQADRRPVTIGTRAGRSPGIGSVHRGRTSGVSVGSGGLRVNVGGARIASPSARHHGDRGHTSTPGDAHRGRIGSPDHRNDALRKLQELRGQRLSQPSLLRRLPQDNLLRRSHDDHGFPDGAHGPSAKRDILRRRLHTYLPSHRRYAYPYGGSVIIQVPGVYYRSYEGTVYTVPGASVYEEQQVYVDPGPSVPPERVEVVPADHGAAASAEGWALLARGRVGDALTQFSRASQTYRGAGVPQIGVALSLAMLDQFDGGAWAMRRALRLDVGAVAHVPVDEALAERLQKLMLEYRRGEQHAVLAKDATFMLAALCALLGDAEAAHEMIGLAIEVGDTSEAAAVFRKYLDAASPRGPVPIE